MKQATLLKLATIEQHCEHNNKSDEETVQLMQDTCNVSLDTCTYYFGLKLSFKDTLKEQVNAVVNTVVTLNNL